MTNAELIQTIMAEIESRQEKAIESSKRTELNTAFYSGKAVALGSLRSFLYTLEKSGKPMNQEGLEEDLTNEADKMFFSLGFYEGDHHQPMLDEISQEQFQGIARHFAKWGAEHANID